MAFKSPSPSSSPSLEDQLESLYARRSALEDLIRSLERYSRCADSPPPRKSAAYVRPELAKASFAS